MFRPSSSFVFCGATAPRDKTVAADGGCGEGRRDGAEAHAVRRASSKQQSARHARGIITSMRRTPFKEGAPEGSANPVRFYNLVPQNPQ
jgi:hypothetical protein